MPITYGARLKNEHFGGQRVFIQKPLCPPKCSFSSLAPYVMGLFTSYDVAIMEHELAEPALVRNPFSGLRVSDLAHAFVEDLIAERGVEPPNLRHLLRWADQIDFRLASPEKRQAMLDHSREVYEQWQPGFWAVLIFTAGGLLFTHDQPEHATMNLMMLGGFSYYYPRAMRRDRALAQWLES